MFRGRGQLMMRLVTLLTALIFVSSVLLTCKQAPAPTPTAKPAPAPVVEKPRYGGVLQIAWIADPGSFDLHSTAGQVANFVQPMFNNLVAYDLGKAELKAENIVPDLAERWETTPDGLSYTFYLRKGVKWHDGLPFTAEDVKYNLEKMTDRKRSGIASNFSAFDRVELVDSHTVKVFLKFAQATFLMHLASPFAGIYPKHTASVKPKSTNFLVGTGPFKLKEYIPGVSFEMAQNPDYFKKGLPYLDGIKINIIKDRSTWVPAFVARRLHMDSPLAGFRGPEEMAEIKAGAPEAILHLMKGAMSRPFFVNLKTGAKALGDVRVRKAMALVLDQDQIVEAAYGKGWGMPDSGLFFPPSGMALPAAEIKAIIGWDKPYADRVAEAKRLMAEAGYGAGFKMRILTRSVVEYKRALAVAADIWQRHLNIDSTIDVRERGVVAEMLTKKDFDLAMDNIAAVTGDPDEYVGPFITGDTLNWMGYSNPRVDELALQQARATDVSARKKLVQELERIVLTDLPIVPTGLFTVRGVAYYPTVKGFVPQTATYAPSARMERVWLAE